MRLTPISIPQVFVLLSFFACLVVPATVAGQGVDGASADSSSETAVDVVIAPPELPSEDVIEEALASGRAELLASTEQQELLGEWMKYTAAAGRRSRLFNGANSLIASSILMGFGIALFVSSPDTELSKGGGLALVAGSGLLMAVGITQLAKESQPELRFERWNQAAKSRMSLQELGRFEGELRAQAESVERTALVGRWTSFGLALTGGLILGLTPAADLSGDAATASYVAGGAALAVGLLGFGLSFAGGGESVYEAYKRGRRPPAYSRDVAVRVAPAAGRGFAGARLVGTF